MTATTPDLRRDALACLRAAISAVEPRALVDRFLAEHPEVVPAGARVSLVGIGKAANAMARGARGAVAERLGRSLLLVPAALAEEAPAGFEVYGGGHPIPTQEGVAGAGAVQKLAAGLGEDDLLLVLISGGGSALMTLPPPGVTLEEVQETTQRLLEAGASIQQLNVVRKHLDLAKGGRLAAAAAPARVVALVLSDAVGDPLDVIASGPVSPDPTSYLEAVEISKRLGVWGSAPRSVREHLTRGRAGREPESTKPGDPCFERVSAHVVGNNRLAAAAALAEAERRGYGTLLLSTLLTGEAREVGRVLAAVGREVRASGAPLAPPACLVAAGETTVKVRGDGRGGRNQELALGAALELDGGEGILVASLGTDGIDGPTDAAGAIAAGDTFQRAWDLGLDPGQAFRDNDAYPFFQALDDLIVTGPTGTNVMDVAVVMVA